METYPVPMKCPRAASLFIDDGNRRMGDFGDWGCLACSLFQGSQRKRVRRALGTLTVPG